MKTDYKFWYIRRSDDIHIDEAAIRFYEGDITTEDEYNIEGKRMIPVTRYRRSKRLQIGDMPHFKNRKFMKERNGNDVMVYTPKDFGVISTDDDLRLFLNKELAKDKIRKPIDEQK